MPESTDRPTEIISVRVPPALRRKLRAAAEVEGVSVSDVARRGLRSAAARSLAAGAVRDGVHRAVHYDREVDR